MSHAPQLQLGGAAPAGSGPLPAHAIPVALGRHALALIAQDLRARGISSLAVPDYHCLTMVMPFQLEGFHCAHVPVGADLMANAHALKHIVLGSSTDTDAPPPSGWAILHCEVFGAAPSPDLACALRDLRQAGAALVLDETHLWPLPAHLDADYQAASLRKLMGLPDGAFAAGGAIGTAQGPRPGARGRIDGEATAAWLAGSRDYAEDLMDLQLSPVDMSPQAAEVLAGCAPDLSAQIGARRARMASLHDALVARDLPVVSPRDGHFCVAFRDPAGPAHARRLIEALARAGVDGPVWWPRPSGWTRAWPDDIVTLPVAPNSPYPAAGPSSADQAHRASCNDGVDTDTAGLLDLLDHLLA